MSATGAVYPYSEASVMRWYELGGHMNGRPKVCSAQSTVFCL